MSERPILFNAAMVRAILEGRKRQTRRIVKPQPECVADPLHVPGAISTRVLAYPEAPGVMACYGTDQFISKFCRYGQPGDRLWVKETWTGAWHPTRQSDTHILVEYAADGSEAFHDTPGDYVLPKAAQKVGNWVTPLFMPRWASRITLEIADIRVQRLLEITESDAMAEGADPWKFGPEQCLTTGERGADSPCRSGFACLWDDINAGRATWKSNPWVWAVTFSAVTA